jgi:hypothetical protein
VAGERAALPLRADASGDGLDVVLWLRRRAAWRISSPAAEWRWRAAAATAAGDAAAAAAPRAAQRAGALDPSRLSAAR